MNASAMSDGTASQPSRERPEVIDLDGLFCLYLQRDGTYRAEFGKLTTNLEVAHRWKLHPSEGDLVMGLLAIARKMPAVLTTREVPSPRIVLFKGSNIHQIHQAALEAKSIAELLRFFLLRFSNAIGVELETLVDVPTSQTASDQAKARILKKVSHALDAITSRSKRATHKSTTTVEYWDDNGDPQTAVLPWIVLQVARELAAERLALPTKGEIQLVIGDRFPQLRGLGKTKWRNTWKECGLGTLAQGTPWEFEERKRSQKPRTKKR